MKIVVRILRRYNTRNVYTRIIRSILVSRAGKGLSLEKNTKFDSGIGIL